MALVQIPGEEEEEEEYVYDGPVLQMSSAVLPSNFPLFDLNDWPKSKAALVPGGVTRNFEKACWNALMDRMDRAAWEAGFYFYDAEAGYGAKDLKMTTGVFGTLTADRMNAVVAAFDNFLPWRWIWKFERDPPYPIGTMGMKEGYWSKSVFFGASDRLGREPDVVYPEYIPGLVRRVNILIQFMRDNYPYTVRLAASCNAVAGVRPGLRAGISGPIFARHRSRIIMPDTPVFVREGVVVWQRNLICRTYAEPGLQGLRAGTLNIPIHYVYMPVLAYGEVKWGGQLKIGNVISGTTSSPNLESIFPADTAAPVLSYSKAGTAMEWIPGQPIDRKMRFLSCTEAAVDSIFPTETDSYMQMFTTQKAEADWKESHSFTVKMRQESRQTAKADLVKLLESAARLRIVSQTEAAMESGRFQSFGASCLSNGRTETELGAAEGETLSLGMRIQTCRDVTALLAGRKPMWAEGHSVTAPQAAAELIDPLICRATQRSTIRSLVSLGTAWDAPIRQDGGLWIRQVRTYKRREDGSLDLSGSGDPINALQASGILHSVSLDTAWQPPVWQDGGLYIKQVREIRIMEDGSLDLTGEGDRLDPQCNSRTKAKAAMDTAWYPPQWNDDGLWIRQAQQIAIYENNELEVT